MAYLLAALLATCIAMYLYRRIYERSLDDLPCIMLLRVETLLSLATCFKSHVSI